jgi:hypothetical protein
MPTQLNHAGFECPLVANGVDRHVTSWELTVNNAPIEVTNTSDYNATDDRCYTRKIRGKTSGSGSWKEFFDTNQKPWPGFRDGSSFNVVANCDLTGSTITFPVILTSLKCAPTALDGVVEVDVNFDLNGRPVYV